MPETITKEDGTQVEVFTKEEIDAQLAEKETVFNDRLQQKEQELKEKQDELARLQQGGDVKDENLRKAREAIESKEKEKEAIIAQHQKEIGEVKEMITGNFKEDAIKALVGNDEELRKKVEYHFARIKDEATTRDAITKKVADAYTLATGGQAPNPLAQAAGSGGANPGDISSNKSGLAPEVADFGKKQFGLSDEDIKKAQDKGLL